MPQVSSVPVDRTPLPADAGARKPYNGVEGYWASLRSGAGGGYVVIYVAERRKLPLSTRFGVVCEVHGVAAGAATDPAARLLMKVPGRFCEGCATALNPFGGLGGGAAKAVAPDEDPPAAVPADDGGGHYEQLAGYVSRARGPGGPAGS